jgi:hypothetical protein
VRRGPAGSCQPSWRSSAATQRHKTLPGMALCPGREKMRNVVDRSRISPRVMRRANLSRLCLQCRGASGSPAHHLAERTPKLSTFGSIAMRSSRHGSSLHPPPPATRKPTNVTSLNPRLAVPVATGGAWAAFRPVDSCRGGVATVSRGSQPGRRASAGRVLAGAIGAKWPEVAAPTYRT